MIFFSDAESRIEPSGPQLLKRDGTAYVLTLPVSFNLTGNFGRLAGVLAAVNGFSASARAATIDVPLAGVVGAGGKPALAAAPALNLALDFD